MRRSNSHSQIPVKLFGGKKEPQTIRPRAQSASRLSQQRESVVKRRNSSMERRSKLSLPKVTPLRRVGSYNKLTPSSVASSSRSSRISPATGLKERTTIQKLSNNSNWVDQQYKKLLRFLETSEVIDSTVINPSNIRPPSIKGFIYLTTVILNELFENLNITKDNYKEEIVKRLKILHYPGTMTNSTLKSVNTMHSWPQIIGMFGWLIDKVDVGNTAKIDCSVWPKAEKQNLLVQESINNCTFQRYEIFNYHQNSPDLNEQTDQEFVDEIKKLLDVNPEEYDMIKSEVEQNLRYKDKLRNDTDNLKQEDDSIKMAKDNIKNQLEIQMESDAEKQAGLEVELAYFSNLVQKLDLKENTIKSRINKLQEQLKNQQCSYHEKQELINTFEALKNELNIVKGKIQHAFNIKNEFDVKINGEREKLQSKVIEWNHTLRAVCIQKPYLKSLILKEKGFHTATFLEETSELSKAKQVFENELKSSLESINATHKQLITDIQNIKTDIEKLNSETIKMELESEEYCKETADLDTNAKQILDDWIVQRNNFILEKADPSDSNQIQCLCEEIIALKSTGDELADEIRNFSKGSIKFLVFLNNNIENQIEEINRCYEIKEQQVEELILNKQEENEHKIKFLKSLNVE